MLGFVADSRQPVALLPRSARSYQVVDPATGAGSVTAEVAAHFLRDRLLAVPAVSAALASSICCASVCARVVTCG